MCRQVKIAITKPTTSPPGTAAPASRSLALTPGGYEAVRNLPGHYAAGMFTDLDVS